MAIKYNCHPLLTLQSQIISTEQLYNVYSKKWKRLQFFSGMDILSGNTLPPYKHIMGLLNVACSRALIKAQTCRITIYTHQHTHRAAFT